MKTAQYIINQEHSVPSIDQTKIKQMNPLAMKNPISRSEPLMISNAAVKLN